MGQGVCLERVYLLLFYSNCGECAFSSWFRRGTRGGALMCTNVTGIPVFFVVILVVVTLLLTI